MDKALFENTKTVKKSGHLAIQIRQRILSGEFNPGDPALQEKDIMEEFHVSKGTAREALKILESQGLIDIRTGPKGGVSVTQVSVDKANEMMWNYFFRSDITIKDIYQVRKVLEPLLAEIVTPLLSRDTINRLAVNLDSLDCVGKYESTAERIVELDFHKILAECCPNPILAFFIQFIINLLEKIVMAQGIEFTDESEKLKMSGYNFHADLLKSFLNKDAVEATRLMSEHMKEAEAYMLQFLNDQQILKKE
ncbi:MAG: FadR family transcriptional regulator [SAR324 cluster bacterium]|nr:FadR family transcriptional regulator [SAR324 cluster bacterium]